MRALKLWTGHVIYNPAYTYKFKLKTTNIQTAQILFLSSFFQLSIVLGMYNFAYLLKHGKTFNGISHDIISQGNFWSAWLKAISYNNVSTFCFGYFLVYIMAMVR